MKPQAYPQTYAGWPNYRLRRAGRGWKLSEKWVPLKTKPGFFKVGGYFQEGGYCPVYCEVCGVVKKKITKRWIFATRLTNRINDHAENDGFLADVCPSCWMKFYHIHKKIEKLKECRKLVKELENEIRDKRTKDNGQPTTVSC